MLPKHSQHSSANSPESASQDDVPLHDISSLPRCSRVKQGLLGVLCGLVVILCISLASEIQLVGLRGALPKYQELLGRPTSQIDDIPKIDNDTSVAPLPPSPPAPHYKACQDEYSLEHEAFTFCTLTTCDDQGQRLRMDNEREDQPLYGSPVEGRCQINTMITRDVLQFQPLERDRNDQQGNDRFSFLWYPGKGPWTQIPNCKDWFFDLDYKVRDTMNKYLQWKIPTPGISTSICYNDKVKRNTPMTSSSPKVLYIYAAYTNSPYARDVSVFNLQAARRAFGDDLFVIFVEANTEHDFSPFMDYVDVFLHGNFATPDMYYDATAYQEGMLEAFRIFGKDLVGIELAIVINDSLMGPFDTNIANKLLSVQDSTIISLGVWANTIVSGSGVAFTRQLMDQPYFSYYWRYVRFPCGKWGSMAFYEGRLHEYFMDQGAQCVTFSNDIMKLNQAHRWRDLNLPFYKHRNKAEGQKSVFERWQERVEGQEDKALSREDYFNMDEAEVKGLDLRRCSLSHSGFAWDVAKLSRMFML